MAVERIRTDVKTDKDGFFIERPGPYYAIAIGPGSDVDECFIVPSGLSSPIPPVPAGLDGTVNRDHLIHPEMIHVSVERPFIGEINGPFRVLYPYAHSFVGSTPRRLRPYDDALWFMSSVTVPPTRKMDIELELHTCMPGWLPTKRPPLKVPFRFPSFGSTGVSDVDMLIPIMGRKQLLVSIKCPVASGSLTWSVAGLVVIENTDGALQISHSETLQADTVESASFEKTYLFDGEFDVLWVRVDETTAMPVTQTVSGIIKAWD